MGKKGPPPTPLAILEARGTTGDKTWHIKNKCRVDPGRPTCPSWINKESKKAWRWMMQVLDQMRVLSLVDRNAITRYCRTWARWKEAELFLQEHGDTYPVKNAAGVVVGFKNFPQVKVADHLSTQLNRLEQAFGLTPSARARIEQFGFEDGITTQKEPGEIKFFTGIA